MQTFSMVNLKVSNFLNLTLYSLKMTMTKSSLKALVEALGYRKMSTTHRENSQDILQVWKLYIHTGWHCVPSLKPYRCSSFVASFSWRNFSASNNFRTLHKYRWFEFPFTYWTSRKILSDGILKIFIGIALNVM